jgi:hypothetical protein
MDLEDVTGDDGRPRPWISAGAADRASRVWASFPRSRHNAEELTRHVA